MSLWAFLDFVMVLSYLYSLNSPKGPFSSTSILHIIFRFFYLKFQKFLVKFPCINSRNRLRLFFSTSRRVEALVSIHHDYNKSCDFLSIFFVFNLKHKLFRRLFASSDLKIIQLRAHDGFYCPVTEG